MNFNFGVLVIVAFPVILSRDLPVVDGEGNWNNEREPPPHSKAVKNHSL